MLRQTEFLLSTAIQTAIVLSPVLAIGVLKKRHSSKLLLASCLTLLLALVQAFVLTIPNFGFFADWKMNWWQKLAMFLICVGAALALKVTKKIDCGLKLPASKSAWLWAFAFGLIAAIPAIVSDFVSGDVKNPSLEYLLFEMTMPGLQEESFYRGVLLAIWDSLLGRPWKLAGIQFGWGAVISMFLFILGHLCMVDKSFQIMLAPDLLPWLDFIFFVLLITWLRYRFNSIWPLVLTHNLGNTLEALSGFFIHK